ncbi:MAG: hypothetical protein JO261_13545, partial [Alphaproteobacteria bacterium]|nr:hypothetical protein [Alphaproteobacteria bacterium]
LTDADGLGTNKEPGKLHFEIWDCQSKMHLPVSKSLVAAWQISREITAGLNPLFEGQAF